MKQSDLEFFKKNGYVSLGKMLSDAEVAEFVRVFDRDCSESSHWYKFGHHQTVNCDALMSSPEFDRIVRHPIAMDALGVIMGDDICFSEICLRHMAPYDGEIHRAWHRDGPAHWLDHPLRVGFTQLMLYLTDVNESTHCFTVSPESVDEPILAENAAQLARGGIADLYGPAGTGLLFNIGALHTATTRPTTHERKTAQIYYGFADRPYLSEDSIIPAALWRDHDDPETRRFYGALNAKTRDFYESGEYDEHAPLGEKLAALRELDAKYGRRKA